MPLSTMLGLLTQDVLRARPISGGRVIFDPPRRRSETFVWEGTVREFEEVDRPPRVFAAVRLSLVLFATPTTSSSGSGVRAPSVRSVTPGRWLPWS
jgi:hypothetical protein